MPKGSQHSSASLTKMLLIGESGSGKSGALASLAAADYKLRILDFDNGLDFLMRYMRKNHPDKIDNIEFVSLRDKLKKGPQGMMPVGIPSAYANGVGLLDKWEDGSNPQQWGPEYVLVIDSLTFMAQAAFRWKEALNPNVKDPRTIFYAAQDATEDVLAAVTSPDFNANVIVTSHVRWMERQDGTTKAFPTAIGGALSPKIPTYFNSLVLAETVGQGASVRRQIRTAPTIFLDLKNPAGADLSQPLPIKTGLADFFRKVQE